MKATVPISPTAASYARNIIDNEEINLHKRARRSLHCCPQVRWITLTTTYNLSSLSNSSRGQRWDWNHRRIPCSKRKLSLCLFVDRSGSMIDSNYSQLLPGSNQIRTILLQSILHRLLGRKSVPPWARFAASGKETPRSRSRVNEFHQAQTRTTHPFLSLPRSPPVRLSVSRTMCNVLDRRRSHPTWT